MRNVICCWCDKNPDDFENHVPLYFAGKRNVRLGFRNSIDILFLDGYDLFSKAYKNKLREVGYELHDVKKIYFNLADKYSGLNVFKDYEKKCFLRWLVISSYFQGEPIIHYDGDIVFNEDPDVINRLLQGRTFVLQGCPALTCISDQAWFEHYQEQLDLYEEDIEGYSAKAWIERDGWEISDREKWAGQRFREIISSDQDFISHLIHTDRIVQDKPSALLSDLSAYMLFENPLYLPGYQPQCNDLPLAYERRADIDYINGRRVLVWHMQGYFNQYLSKFIFRRKYLRRGLKRLSNHVEKKDLDYYMNDFFIRYFHGKNHLRLNVYKYFFEEHDFSEVLTDRTWWEEGAFV